MQDRLASLGGVMTDAAVPEGHAGLHGFLYGDGGAEAHDSAGYTFREVTLPTDTMWCSPTSPRADVVKVDLA